MMKLLAAKRVFVSLLALSICSLLAACGGGGGGGGGRETSEILDPAVVFSSRCGTPIDLVLTNPVTTEFAEAVTVSPISADTVVVTRLEGPQAGNSQLVKLQGINSNNDFGNGAGVNTINQMLSGGTAALVTPSVDGTCAVVVDGGGEGIAAQLFSLSGESINEKLLTSGAVETAVDVCGSDLLQGCYETLEAEGVSPKVIRDFLWKPISESNGNLAVLVDPSQITVVVTGDVSDTLINTGPSNGRGTTARSARFPGSRFGSNVVVEFFDENGKRVLLGNGERSVIIPSGSQRVRNFY